MHTLSWLKIIVLSVLLGIASPGVMAITDYLPADNSAATPTVDPSSPEAVREMVSRLSDKEVRDLLINRLDVVASQQVDHAEQPSLWAFSVSTLLSIAEPVERAIRLLPQTLGSLQLLGARIQQAAQPDSLWLLCTALALSIGCGLLGYALFWRALAPLQRALDRRADGAKAWRRLGVFSLRVLLVFAAIEVFIWLSFTPLTLLLGPQSLEIADVFMRRMAVFALAAYSFFELLLATRAPHRRLLNFDQWHAHFILRHATAVVLLIGSMSALFALSAKFDIARGTGAIGFWLNLGVFFYFAFVALRGKRGFSALLRHADDTPRERQVASAYPYFIVAVVVFTWLLVEVLAANGYFRLIRDGRQYIFMAILVWAPAMDSAIRWLVYNLQAPIMGEGLIAERAHESTKRSYIRIGRVLLIGLVLNSSMNIWELDFVNLASAGLGSQLVLRLVDCLWTVLMGYLVWELATLWINRKLAAEQTAAGMDLESEEIGGEGGGAGSSRLSTVLPLLRWAAQAVIVTSTALLALGRLGVDTTPLLAGAGVVGLAIGFGAQKLVTDVVSGIFFLIDDAFRAGEYVEVETTVGTVEKISLRSMQLRHHRGPVHTIPYGEIPKVTNFSRDWVIMKLRFTVPFDTDLHKVKKIFKKIGQELMEVPEFAEDLLQPFKSQGAIEVDDVGIVVRGKFMAKPGKQFTLRKEVYQRVQRAFEENGLQFARKEVRVKVDAADAGPLSDNDKQAIAAAAAESAATPPPNTSP